MAASNKPVVTALFGSTGLVGNHMLAAMLGSSDFGTVHTVSRREPKQAPAPKLSAVVEPETDMWAGKIATLSPAPAAVLSAVGTTRASAGGIANQWKIDHDLNVELVRAAKAAGARTFVFISSVGTGGALAGASPYSRMKAGVERAIREAGFEHAVVVRPGIIMGERTNGRKVEWLEGLVQSLANGVGCLSAAARDSFAQDAEVIGRAAVAALRHVETGTAPSKFWEVEQADIVRLGRTEWKETPPS